MIFQLGDLLVQFAPPENDSYAVFDQKLYKQADHIHKITDTRHDEKNGENTAAAAHLVHLAVTDGGQGDDGHIYGIANRPTLDNHVPARTDQYKGRSQDQAKGEMAFTFHDRSFFHPTRGLER